MRPAAARLADALQTGGIFYHLPGPSKEEALRAVVDIIPLPADIERDFIFHMLLAREHGLHTCAQEAWSVWNRTVAQFLQAPPELMLFSGMALGYRD